MGQRLRPEHLELYKKIDEILWNNGCPLGTSGTPADRDEYFHYLPEVFRMTMGGATCSAIADYLRSIAKPRQDRPGDASYFADIATSIIQEKKARRL